MIKNGASIIDVGGESTRPKAKTIDANEEINRIIPFIKKLRKITNIPISVDTRKSIVAEKSLEEGANIINDISGLKYDKNMAKIINKYQAGCILMHMRGEPHNMHTFTQYENLIGEVIKEINESIAIARNNDIQDNHIMLDPGIGFSKTFKQNLQLMNELEKITDLPYPVLIGTSRKSFIGKVLNESDPQKRLWGTGASLAVALTKGVRFFRVHDVAEMNDVIRVSEAINNSS